jgi:hypothetical protein
MQYAKMPYADSPRSSPAPAASSHLLFPNKPPEKIATRAKNAQRKDRVAFEREARPAPGAIARERRG